MPDTFQTVIPMLAYEDGLAALDWLVRAFGFVVRTRWLDDAGRLTHGELLAGDALIMLASPSPDYQSPKTLSDLYEPARRWMQVPWILNGVLVYVDDLDAHFQQSQAAGARILSPIEEGLPGRRYRAADLEGQRWFFFQKPS